ncbi:charged multivesicular body protein 3 [Balaenoptera musculus]|uniref:Charged multivesicular body protein 3 n=2 Tax=Balaenoptera musculus TaxID=9771 RepID=A0A8B8Z1T5_BALMU|nr:charged multivesicular body protein 3 [Balaenoptera musculus]
MSWAHAHQGSPRPLPAPGAPTPSLSAAPPRRLPVTCLGAGNGKLGGVRRVQFAMGLFGKTPEKPPKELVNEWSLKIRKEMRVVDRQIRDIQREEEKVKRSVKDAAKKGQKDVCVVLAKEMIRSRKTVSKLYASKAHMNSVLMGMKNQLAVLRVAGSLQKSTEVMKAMQSLVKIPEIQATMRDLSKEMMKAGIIEEMLEDTFESMDDQEEMEEAAEMEIDKILFEITTGALGKAPSKVTDALPEPELPGAMAASEDEEEEEALEAMQSRLATLRS